MDETPVCGSSGCGLFGHEDPFGCSLRTYLLSELAAMTGYTMRWTRSVTPSGRSWWVLRLSARPIDDGESGLWRTIRKSETDEDFRSVTVRAMFPTPTASPNQNRDTKMKPSALAGTHGASLAGMVSQWPTATVAGNHNQAGASPNAGDGLSTAVKMWQTPEACQALGGHTNRGGKRKSELLLGGQCRQGQGSTNGKPRGSLNWRWVSQLQGYPDDWLLLSEETLSKLSETPSSRKSQRQSSKRGKQRKR